MKCRSFAGIVPAGWLTHSQCTENVPRGCLEDGSIFISHPNIALKLAACNCHLFARSEWQPSIHDQTQAFLCLSHRCSYMCRRKSWVRTYWYTLMMSSDGIWTLPMVFSTNYATYLQAIYQSVTLSGIECDIKIYTFKIVQCRFSHHEISFQPCNRGKKRGWPDFSNQHIWDDMADSQYWEVHPKRVEFRMTILSPVMVHVICMYIYIYMGYRPLNTARKSWDAHPPKKCMDKTRSCFFPYK